MYYELLSLLLTGSLLALIWFPSSCAKYQSFGLDWLTGNRATPSDRVLPEWGQRAERAQKNLQDYFPSFLAVLFTLFAIGYSSPLTVQASMTFALSRYVHALSYMAGLARARALIWFISMAALACLYWEAFRALIAVAG